MKKLLTILMMGIFMLSVISLVSATKFRNAPMREDTSKIKNFFLTILQQKQEVYGRTVTFEDCMTIAGYTENQCWTELFDGGQARYVTDCYWDGACYCTQYMNDESLYNVNCPTIKDWVIGMGYEWCIYGTEKCEDTDYFVCQGLGYKNMGKVKGKCGYTQECQRYGVDAVREKCEGSTYYLCIPGDTWEEVGIIKGECGVECIDYTDCGYAELCENNLCKSYVTCTTGEKKCVEKNVVSCSNNKWSVAKTCPVLCSDGECVTTPPTPKPFLSKFFGGIWSWIKSIFGF